MGRKSKSIIEVSFEDTSKQPKMHKIDRKKIKTTDQINEETFKRQALDELNYKKEPAQEPIIKDKKPIVIVSIENYMRLKRQLNGMNDDINELEKIFKYMKWDDQQDARKYSKKITETIHKFRSILFPGEIYR